MYLAGYLLLGEFGLDWRIALDWTGTGTTLA
jgi:hypothetical protein